MKKGVLGKGLSALLPTAGNGSQILRISVNMLRPNHDQPRKKIGLNEIKELSNSIAEYGVLQPIIVNPQGDGRYEIVSGERRWRAAIAAGLKEIPAIPKNLTEKEISEIALIENIQREDLKPLEEAQAYNNLMTKFNYTQEDLATKLCKSRSYIANMLRLLKLPDFIKEKLNSGEITVGHARAILASDDPESLTKSVVENNMTVREVENKVSGNNINKKKDFILTNVKKILSNKANMEQFLPNAKLSVISDGGKTLFLILSESDDETNMIKDKIGLIRSSNQ
ncbi:ParB/RepB/Spo0J family partition protein [Candidatus Cyrtobacter comes]|nr:ParB/RepB/Spo0J family partition protein [Candidatus Cyrtobacter comes]